jgi:hypothetical protein
LTRRKKKRAGIKLKTSEIKYLETKKVEPRRNKNSKVIEKCMKRIYVRKLKNLK